MGIEERRVVERKADITEAIQQHEARDKISHDAMVKELHDIKALISSVQSAWDGIGAVSTGVIGVAKFIAACGVIIGARAAAVHFGGTK